jgi:hypothetical protein
MARIEDSDLAVDPASQDPRAQDPHGALSPRDQRAASGLAIPSGGNTVEIPATRSAISDAAQFMHNLSLSPSMKDRRGSRNSFGTSLPHPPLPPSVPPLICAARYSFSLPGYLSLSGPGY